MNPNPNAICMVCDRHEWKSPVLMVCGVEGDGQSIVDHGKSGYCPLGKFDKPLESPPPNPLKPISREQWPAWVNLLAARAVPEDVGIGDVVARLIGEKTGLLFKAAFKALTGMDCGCSGRQASWNILYKLK